MLIDHGAAGPVTRASLARDFRALGVRPDGVLLVHSSLRSLGWVSGGALAVVQALLDVLGPGGTLVVPSQTADNRDPSTWSPRPPEAWWPVIRDTLPGFDPARTPSARVGVIPEQVRTWPGAVRSAHPQTSFAAIGPRAADLMSDHRIECHLGERSPLAALDAAGAATLLLGVGFAKATAFHLGEYRVPFPPRRTYGCAILTPDGGRRWCEYEDVALDDSDFARLGADFERHTGVVSAGRAGAAPCRLFPIPDAVEYAQKWFIRYRAAPGAGA
ncbi:aminoglycoside N(3)-acetyltransferase [Pseudosporangium ferrugineum]|uniref:Aminoglycoside N(3)-acetyltransferase n=1 Tax=Pseudosporangium ferrugineum TaxID=439699 RepID=A0A2T0S7B1_9ACTN|nr:AAC(3) family N-acetyltransferase [Pseudosporangium ferrugineum]PRY29304.1 aminoglycoside 3-N-acetyltransferase [Pseudosporangium ferrugineum]